MSLSLTCTSPSLAVIGTSYTQSFTASSGTSPYTFTLLSGALPDGLILDTTTGIISGLPVASGVNTFTVQVTEFLLATATASDTISVASSQGWLIVDEPILGLTDRSNYLSFDTAHKHSFSLKLTKRGQASIPLLIKRSDSYMPTRGTPLFLYDITASARAIVFAGLIQDIEYEWLGVDGDRVCTITAVSLESLFDTVYAPPFQYVNQTCGFIVADLLSRLESGCPVTAGTISAGAVIPLLVTNYEKISELFNTLATTSAFTWGIDPTTSTLFFDTPASIPAPFTLTDVDVLWDSPSWKLDGSDYRNRQAVKLSYDAFSHSMEFFQGAGQTSFTLKNSVQQVVAAYATLSTCNTSTGTLSTQPSTGETVTVGPANGAWVANNIYSLGGIIIVGGFVQKVTFAGTSAPTIPTFLTVTGDTTVDDTVVWTCQGPSGLATGTETYTFVASLDNMQFGQVLIGAASSDTCTNLFDAINANPVTRGSTFSLPTWECSQCNAVSNTGSTFVLQQKAAGSGWVSSISTTSTAFSWSSSSTTGGTSPQGSLGPGEGATLSLQVYAQGTSTASPALVYVQGSNVVTLASPLNYGSNLNLEYTRADGNIIECERTDLVAQLATLSHGTGKVQQITDATSQGLISNSSAAGLLLAQTALAAFSVTPTSFDFETYVPGLYPGQTLAVALANVVNGDLLLNGDWIIEEIDATMIPSVPYLGVYGHYRYSVKMVDIQQVGSYLDFWEGLSGGSSGSSGLVATSGGAQTPGAVPGDFPLDFSDANNAGSSFITPSGGKNAFKYNSSSFMNSTCTGCTFTGIFNGVCFKNATMNSAVLTGSFIGCDFTNASIDGMTMSGNFSNCDFTGATISATGVTATGCNFTGANWTDASVNSGDYHGSIFLAGTFLNTVMTGSNFKGCNFAGVLFQNVSLDSSLFAGFAWAPTCVNNCTLIDTSTTGATFDGSNLANTFCVNSGPVLGAPPTVIGCNLSGTLFNGTAVQFVSSTYTVTPFDCNTLLSVSASVTVTLPSPAALSSTWQVSLKNTSSGTLTIDPGSASIDGAAGVLTLAVSAAGLQIWTDGSSFFTS